MWGLEDGWRYMENNAVHTSRRIKHWKQENDVQIMPQPALSPDVNIMENMWHIIKDKIKRYHNPKTHQGLINSLYGME
jgi:hypothetical protein